MRSDFARRLTSLIRGMIGRLPVSSASVAASFVKSV
jgi:hypothetical protein